VKGVCRAGEYLVGELRVVDGARHRNRPDESRESQGRFVSLGVGLGLSNQANEPVDVPSYLPAVGLARSGTASRDVGRDRRHRATDLRVVPVSFARVAIDDLCELDAGVQAFPGVKGTGTHGVGFQTEPEFKEQERPNRP